MQSYDYQTVSRICVIGPFAAFFALPVDIIPQKVGGIASVLIAVAFLMFIGIVGTFTGIPFLTNAADSIIDRTVNIKKNWEEDTLRSFLEVLSWLYLTMLLFHYYEENPLVAGALGGIAGLTMVILGEMLTSALRFAESKLVSNTDVKHWKIGSIASAEFVAVSLVIFSGVVLRFRNIHTMFDVTASALFCGTSLVTFGQLLRQWEPTHKYGLIVHDRLINTKENWSNHTFRSSLEVSVWLSATWGSYSLVNDFFAATVLGGIAGLSIIVIGELIFTGSGFVSDITHGRRRVFKRHSSPSNIAIAPSPISKRNSPSKKKSIFANSEKVEENLVKISEKEIKPIYDKDGNELVWREQAGVSGLYPRYYIPRKFQGQPPKIYRMEEVRKHCTKNDIWIVIDGMVYDITSLADSHPGGWIPLSHLAGKDATEAFEVYHPNHVSKLYLPRYYIGALAKEDIIVTPFAHDARKIHQELLRKGLFETSTSFYIVMFSWLIFLFSVALALMFLGESFYSRVVGSAFMMGLFWQQLAFVGHDVGHNSISHVQKFDYFYGSMFGNMLGGISLAWWKKSHNVHHVICNSIENDPDIQHMPFMAVTEKIFKGSFWSTYHEKIIKSDLFARTMVSYQHILFLPIMMFARFNLYVQSWIMIIKDIKLLQYPKVEVISILLFPVWISYVLSYFNDSNEILIWLVISHAVAGFLHVQICISHFPMETFNGEAYTGKDDDEWYKLQLRTTLNVDCYEWADFVHGGLQFQIEHHLFPRLPRHNLRAARIMVKELCAKHGVAYHEASFFDAWKLLYTQMRSTALKVRDSKIGASGYYECSPIWDGLNANG